MLAPTRYVAFTAVLGAATLCAGGAVAQAAFPGEDGRIAFHTDNATTVTIMNPDGSNPVSIPHAGWPAWSPDGRRIAFTSSRNTASSSEKDVWVMDEDGSNAVQVTDEPGEFANQPQWSPDGQQLVFEGVSSGLWIVNVDGTGRRLLTQGDNPDWSPDGRWIAFNPNFGPFGISLIRPDGTGLRGITTDFETTPGRQFDPEWSPDGSKLVISSNQCQRQCEGIEGADLYIIDADGTNATQLTNGQDSTPTWSPSGTRITFTRDHIGGSSPFWTHNREIHVVNIDGTGDTRLTNTAENSHEQYPDWQPLPVGTPSSHVRPKGATPLRVSLVPAFTQCTEANRTHGPPLAFGSCAPPQPISNRLTVGSTDGGQGQSRSAGFVRLEPIIGAPGPPDDTEIQIRVSLTNVLLTATLAEYTGELEGRLMLRTTDKDGAVSSTWRDVRLSFPVPCSGTPDPTLGASCETITTADAVMPGIAAEGTRAVLGLDRIDIADGGPDEDADTADDNALFAVQGIFVP